MTITNMTEMMDGAAPAPDDLPAPSYPLPCTNPDDLPTLIPESRMIGLIYLACAAPAGCFAEVGVYNGGSAQYLYDIAHARGAKMFLFDTFDGIPVAGEHDQHQVGDFGDVTPEDMQAMRRRMPEAFRFQASFADAVNSLMAFPPFAFVHADADQYESTRQICAFFRDRMLPGGMILFDDYTYLKGCRLAVDEAFPDRIVLPCRRALVKF